MPFVVERLGERTPKRTLFRESDTNAGPLAGQWCLEFCWVWSGPMVGQNLGDLGAEVIKVETPKRFDFYRTRGLEAMRGLMDE